MPIFSRCLNFVCGSDAKRLFCSVLFYLESLSILLLFKKNINIYRFWYEYSLAAFQYHMDVMPSNFFCDFHRNTVCCNVLCGLMRSNGKNIHLSFSVEEFATVKMCDALVRLIFVPILEGEEKAYWHLISIKLRWNNRTNHWNEYIFKSNWMLLRFILVCKIISLID